MGQTLYKIPIWRFCIYSLERPILHPQYHHKSFLVFFFFDNKGRQTNFLLLTKIICWPLYRKPIMATLWKRCLYGLQRIVFMLIMYMYITKHHFKGYFVKNWGMRKFSIFFFLPWQLCKNDMFMAWRELYSTARAKSVKLSLMWIVYYSIE